jgi:hypothetical protein
MKRAKRQGAKKQVLNRRQATLAHAMGRSRVTNGKELLPGIDGRSLWTRRMRDLLALHTSDLGGTDQISEAQRSLIRRAAVLTIELEHMELRFAQDDRTPTLLEQYQRCSNTLRRVLMSIGIERQARDVTPPSPLEYARRRTKDAIIKDEVIDGEVLP